MLITEMHAEFKLRGDAVDSQVFPDFTPREIDSFLNSSLNLVVKHTYKIDLTGSGFENDEDKIEKLSTLHLISPERQPELTPANVGNGVYELDTSTLSSELWWITKVEAKITKEQTSKYVRCRPKKADQLEDAFSRPSFFWKRCPVVIAKSSTGNSKSIYFYTDEDFSVDKARVSYIKKPNRLWFGTYNHIDGASVVGDTPISCDIPDIVHDEIVNWAVLEAFRSIGHPNMPLIEKIIKEQFSK